MQPGGHLEESECRSAASCWYDRIKAGDISRYFNRINKVQLMKEHLLKD